LHFSPTIQNSKNTQETVVSQNRSDEGDNGQGTTESGRPSQEGTSLAANLSEFEEVCQSALEQQTLQDVTEKYKIILHQARNDKDDIAEQEDLASIGGGTAQSLEHRKESSNLGLALLDARKLFNDTSDLMKAIVLGAFKGHLTIINEMPQSTVAHCLRDVADKFASHASSLNGPAVKLIRRGWYDESFKWLNGPQADRFIRQSHFAFQKGLQAIKC
jgi:hypothetical protein